MTICDRFAAVIGIECHWLGWWTHSHVLGQTLNLRASFRSQPVAGDVQRAGGHAESERLDAQAAGKSDARGGEHRIACSAVIERAKRRSGELERVGAVNQEGRLGAAGDEDPGGPGGMEAPGGGQDLHSRAAGGLSLADQSPMRTRRSSISAR